MSTEQIEQWHAVSVRVDRDAEEPVSAVLTAAGSTGVAVSELDLPDDGAAPRQPEKIQQQLAPNDVVVTAYFPTSIPLSELTGDIATRLKELASLLNLPEMPFTISSVGADDWVESWQAHYVPERITHEITVIPSWTNDYQPRDGEKVVRLDPKTAFGAGTHQTTQLAIYALEQVMRGGETVLDVGTGTGVLAIVAAELGADQVYAFDNDANAVEIAAANVARNSDANRVNVAVNDLLSGVTTKADIIVANMLAPVLLQMIDDAERLLNDTGHLILSGVYADQIERIRQQTERVGLSVVTAMTQDEWHCVVLAKTSR